MFQHGADKCRLEEVSRSHNHELDTQFGANQIEKIDPSASNRLEFVEILLNNISDAQMLNVAQGIMNRDTIKAGQINVIDARDIEKNVCSKATVAVFKQKNRKTFYFENFDDPDCWEEEYTGEISGVDQVVVPCSFNISINCDVLTVSNLATSSLVEVFTMNGQRVASKRAAGNRVDIELGGLVEGFYVVRVGNVSRKFVVGK